MNSFHNFLFWKNRSGEYISVETHLQICRRKKGYVPKRKKFLREIRQYFTLPAGKSCSLSNVVSENRCRLPLFYSLSPAGEGTHGVQDISCCDPLIFEENTDPGTGYLFSCFRGSLLTVNILSGAVPPPRPPSQPADPDQERSPP